MRRELAEVKAALEMALKHNEVEKAAQLHQQMQEAKMQAMAYQKATMPDPYQALKVAASAMGAASAKTINGMNVDWAYTDEIAGAVKKREGWKPPVDPMEEAVNKAIAMMKS